MPICVASRSPLAIVLPTKSVFHTRCLTPSSIDEDGSAVFGLVAFQQRDARAVEAAFVVEFFELAAGLLDRVRIGRIAHLQFRFLLEFLLRESRCSR